MTAQILFFFPYLKGVVQEPAGQVSQKAEEPAEGAASEAEGGIRSSRGLHGGRVQD